MNLFKIGARLLGCVHGVIGALSDDGAIDLGELRSIKIASGVRFTFQVGDTQADEVLRAIAAACNAAADDLEDGGFDDDELLAHLERYLPNDFKIQIMDR